MRIMYETNLKEIMKGFGLESLIAVSQILYRFSLRQNEVVAIRCKKIAMDAGICVRTVRRVLSALKSQEILEKVSGEVFDYRLTEKGKSGIMTVFMEGQKRKKNDRKKD